MCFLKNIRKVFYYIYCRNVLYGGVKNMIKEKSCGAIICHFDKPNDMKILLIKHKNGGHWSFPKGHVEFGESEKQTALREIKEETGLDVELMDGFRKSVTYTPKPNVIKEVVYFMAVSNSKDTEIQEEEISQAVWIEIDKVHNMVSFQNDKMLIEGVKNFISKRHRKKLV